MRAAAIALRRGPSRIVVAVAGWRAHESCDEFREEVDEVVCAVTPEPFRAVGASYVDFFQTSDEEVRHLLHKTVGDERRVFHPRDPRAI